MGTKKKMAFKRIKKALKIYEDKKDTIEYFNVDDIRTLINELDELQAVKQLNKEIKSIKEK